MKLFVQGRKDGYKVLYPKPTPPEFFQFAGDLRPDGSSNNLLLGKFFYTLAFASGGQIFTKQLIIQDEQRQGLGNIGFSLFIPAQKKIAGEQVIALLDELVQTYITKYCPDYFLDFVQEDWSIFENIVKNYSYKLRDVADTGENLQPGGEDPAYIYYSHKLELQRFFDAPAQDEYAQFKQVFFIDKSFDNRLDNPLKAIRHNPTGNLTGKIDLNNQGYKLIYSALSQAGLRLDVKVNGMSLVKNRVKRNDTLEITWSKAYHESKVKKGTFSEIGSPYLLINEDSKTLTIKEIALNEKTFKFQVKAQDKLSRPILDAELFAFSSITKRKRNLVNNSIILREEELNDNYFIKGIKGNLESEAKELSKMSANQEITLTLLETLKLKIRVFDQRNRNKIIGDTKITVGNKIVRPTEECVEFRGEEINKTWQITVSHPDYKSKTFTFSPATDHKEKTVELEAMPTVAKPSPTERISYQLMIDQQKGKNTWKGEPINLMGKEFQQDIRCDAKYGYKFSGWESKGKQGDCEYYQASFEELWYRKVPKVVWGILPVLIAVGVYFVIHSGDGNGDKTTLTDEEKEKINKYLIGDQLILDSLIKFKTTLDSISSNKYQDLRSRLDSAIKFRILLNNGNFVELKKMENSFSNNSASLNEIFKLIKSLDSNPEFDSSIVKSESLELIIKNLKEEPPAPGTNPNPGGEKISEGGDAGGGQPDGGSGTNVATGGEAPKNNQERIDFENLLKVEDPQKYFFEWYINNSEDQELKDIATKINNHFDIFKSKPLHERNSIKKVKKLNLE